MTLVEREGQTTLTARSVFATPEDRNAMLGSSMESGARESYDRLDELTAATTRTTSSTVR